MVFQKGVFLFQLVASVLLVSAAHAQTIRPRDGLPALSFSTTWETLGPFQIGTREATWGADPLEQFGGFINLTYDPDAKFISSLGRDAVVRWSHSENKRSSIDQISANVDLAFAFDEIDWSSLQSTYGWAALQYQAWTRGHIVVDETSSQIVLLSIENVLEFYVDGEHYFGGDMYAFGKAPVVLRLSPGHHSLDVRLVRDVRAMGGVGDPNIAVRVRAELSSPRLHIVGHQSLFPDIINGQLSSSFASVVVRNDDKSPVEITGIGSSNVSQSINIESSHFPRLIAAGQTRSLPLRVMCTADCPQSVHLTLQIRELSDCGTSYTIAAPLLNLKVRSYHEPFKITYQQANGTVGYAMLRLPEQKAGGACDMNKESFPIMLMLHGAGVEADSEELTKSFDDAGQLCAFLLFPSGGSPWSGDDWHQHGFSHVESAVDAAVDWAKHHYRQRPQPDANRWFVTGHSNGGQGVWYILTHHPDRVVAAAPVSGYSSIQNYVPYSLWYPMDPEIQALLDGVLLSYRHELLVDHLRGIPILQQHGGADNNVPPYHARLMQQLASDVGINSIAYKELQDRGHWFDGVMTSTSLVQFYNTHLQFNATPRVRPLPLSVVTGRPLDTSSVHGVRINSLCIPGQLGKVTISQGPSAGACVIKTRNTAVLTLSGWNRRCQKWTIDSSEVTSPASSQDAVLCRANDGSWRRCTANALLVSSPGGMDAILRAKTIRIATDRANPTLGHIALQLSRNLHQYFGIDTELLGSTHKAGADAIARIWIGGSVKIPAGHPASITNEAASSHTQWFSKLQCRISRPKLVAKAKRTDRVGYGPDAGQYDRDQPEDMGLDMREGLGLEAPRVISSEPQFPTRKQRDSDQQRLISSSSITSPSVEIRDSQNVLHRYTSEHECIGAIFLLPSSGAVPDIAIWGSDAAGLRLAARLMPMLTGVGQPDFIVVGRSERLAMGFFVSNTSAESPSWSVSPNAFFS